MRCSKMRNEYALLYSPLNSGAHGEHLLAVAAYWKATSAVQIVHSFAQAVLKLWNSKLLFVQKSGVPSILLLLLCRLMGRQSLLYLHEPLTVSARRKKGVPVARAILITMAHVVEASLATRVLTGNPNNRVFARKQMYFAPLLFLQPESSRRDWRLRRRAVLYFGRADSEKFFAEFRQLEVESIIVLSRNLNIRGLDLPTKQYSCEERNNLFFGVRYVWCVQRNSLTQSAVLLDAIRFGCCAIVSANDPVCARLGPGWFIEVPVPFDSDVLKARIAAYEEANPTGPPSDDTFSRLCGAAASATYWDPVVASLGEV